MENITLSQVLALSPSTKDDGNYEHDFEVFWIGGGGDELGEFIPLTPRNLVKFANHPVDFIVADYGGTGREGTAYISVGIQ